MHARASGSKQSRGSRRKDGMLNKGVTHKIKRPKIKKIKEKKKNPAKAFLNRTKDIQMPLRLPSNRSPRKDDKKPMKRVLSSPGISLLEDGPEANPEAETEKKKFFTSRSKAAATIALSKGIKLSTKDGELSLANRRTREKKNIGSRVEKELQKEIKLACSLSVDDVSSRLESISKLSTLNGAAANRVGPTRFASTPSPKRMLKRITPKKNLKDQANSIPRRSPRKTLSLKYTPEKSPKKSVTKISSLSVSSPRVKAMLNGSLPVSPKSKSTLPSMPESPKISHVSPRKEEIISVGRLSPRTYISINSSPRRSPRRNLSLKSMRSLEEDLHKSPSRNAGLPPTLINSSPGDLGSMAVVPSPNKSLLMTPLSKTISQIAINDKSPRRSPRRLIAPTSESTPSRQKNTAKLSPFKTQRSTLGVHSCEDEEIDNLGGISTITSSISQENDILCSLLTDESSDENSQHKPTEASLIPMVEKDLNQNHQIQNKKLPQTPKIESENVKYFSIFNPKKNSISSPGEKSSEKKQSHKSKQFHAKRSDPTQLVLDAGQKEFGAKYCDSCGILYDVGDPDDEMAHQEFHHGYFNALKYTGWKAEKQVTNMDLHGGRVIKIVSSDAACYWNKVEEVLEFIDRELGFAENDSLRKGKSAAFLYVRDQKICGCLIAEEISQAYEVIHQITSSKANEKSGKLICCSAQPQKVFAGISRIWVLASERRKGVASCLMEAMRSNFFPYHYLKINEFAFSYPTESGLKFAEKYCNKHNFLVYGRLD